LPAHCSTSRADSRVSAAGCERGSGGVAPPHGNAFPPRLNPAWRGLDTFRGNGLHRARSLGRCHPGALHRGLRYPSLVFCVGPLTILGWLSDSLGRGADQLILKAALDGNASIAFAAALGVGVMASVVAIVVVQGSLTLVGVLVGSALPEAQLAAITPTGGLLLLGVGLRLLQIKAVPVGNLLPALLVAPAGLDSGAFR
jgi:uncharacterized membrane protein YqgA involved in biofilm formation